MVGRRQPMSEIQRPGWQARKRNFRRRPVHTPAWIWLCLLLAAMTGSGAEPGQRRLRPVVTTNYVVVTNVVLVTNYVAVAEADDTGPVPVPGATLDLLSKAALPDLSWVPPRDRYDWIQLNTGEWLKGRLRAMQYRQVDFDSEKLDDLTFDWKDVRQVSSPHDFDVLLVDGRRLTGPVTITPGEVTVGGGPTPQVHPRDHVQSFTPSGSREREYWSVMVSAGLSLRAGNSEQYEYNAQARLQRRTPETRLSLDYIGNLSSVNGVESANNHRVTSEFDYWISRRFYLVLPVAEYYQDPFQNLAHRLTAGVGIGYDLITRRKVEWNITTGPAYQQSWFESVQPGEPTQKGSAALWFGSRFDWDITRRIEWIVEYRGQYTSREIGETTHHAVNTLSLDLTKHFELDVSLVWDRIAQPKIGADGVSPKPDDVRLILGVGLDY